MKNAANRQEGILKRISDSDAFIGLLFVTPFVALWIVWFFIPLIESFLRSFQDANFITLETASFIGLDNYFTLFEDRDFFRAITNSLLLVAVAVPVQTLMALLFAMALYISPDFRVYRVSFMKHVRWTVQMPYRNFLM